MPIANAIRNLFAHNPNLEALSPTLFDWKCEGERFNKKWTTKNPRCRHKDSLTRL
jgi:hypothetical protein